MDEMKKLRKLLDDAKIPYEIEIHWNNTIQICYPCADRGKMVCDVVCFPGSYGYQQGLLEMMGLVPEEVGDSVEGFMTANEVFLRINKHFQKNAPQGWLVTHS